MDLNVYSVECLARDRLAEARARVAREAWGQAALPPSRPWRVALGEALIELGERIGGERVKPSPSLAREVG